MSRDGWLPPGVTDDDIDREAPGYWDEPEFACVCRTCKGRGTVNPLTAPADFFCVGTTDCPTCDGTGTL
jgi:DnaJ-class molecular chaperone